MDLLRRQSSVQQINGKLKAVILIGGPHVGKQCSCDIKQITTSACIRGFRWGNIEIPCTCACEKFVLHDAHICGGGTNALALLTLSLSLFCLLPALHSSLTLLSTLSFHSPLFSISSAAFISLLILFHPSLVGIYLRNTVPSSIAGVATATFPHSWISMATTPH